jgi:plasmid stabilization system protein ParE
MEDRLDICWDFKAGEDLERIFKHLSENAPESIAQKVKKALVSSVERLSTQPESCRPTHYFAQGPKIFDIFGCGNTRLFANLQAKK